MGKIVFTAILWLVLLSHYSYGQKIYFTSTGAKRVALGSSYHYTVAVADSLQRNIQFKVKVPAWVKFNEATNSLSGVAKTTGQYPIQIDVVANDTTITQQFFLTVFDKKTTNILAIGNSITNGTSMYNSYRRPLWQLLQKGRYNFDFIGSWSAHHMGGPVPNPDFDMDHDGHSGWTARHILEPPDWDKQRGNIDQWLGSYYPDIVLMELGTNEVFQCTSAATAMNDLSIIIDKLRDKNKSVRILLAKIPPLGKDWAPKKLCGNDTAYEKALTIFNLAVAKFARNKTTARSPVVIVDQFTGIKPGRDMYDDIHPNERGEKIMAARWYKALIPYLKKL